MHKPNPLAIAFILTLSLTASAFAQDAPLLKILDQFTAADIPTTGPAEAGPTTRNWPNPTSQPANLPGKGLAQHPMLYAGEGVNTLFLVNNGKVICTYSCGRG